MAAVAQLALSEYLQTSYRPIASTSTVTSRIETGANGNTLDCNGFS